MSSKKNEYFQDTYFDFVFALNIDCGYTLEPPRRCGFIHNLCFGAKIRKIGIPLHTPVFTIKVGFKGVFITRSCVRAVLCYSSCFHLKPFYVCNCAGESLVHVENALKLPYADIMIYILAMTYAYCIILTYSETMKLFACLLALACVILASEVAARRGKRRICYVMLY